MSVLGRSALHHTASFSDVYSRTHTCYHETDQFGRGHARWRQDLDYPKTSSLLALPKILTVPHRLFGPMTICCMSQEACRMLVPLLCDSGQWGFNCIK